MAGVGTACEGEADGREVKGRQWDEKGVGRGEGRREDGQGSLREGQRGQHRGHGSTVRIPAADGRAGAGKVSDERRRCSDRIHAAEGHNRARDM